MKLFIAATAALLTASGISTNVVHASGPATNVVVICVTYPEMASYICVEGICVGWNVRGGNPLPINDPQCVPTPLPDNCVLNIPPDLGILSCVPQIETRPS